MSVRIFECVCGRTYTKMEVELLGPGCFCACKMPFIYLMPRDVDSLSSYMTEKLNKGLV